MLIVKEALIISLLISILILEQNKLLSLAFFSLTSLLSFLPSPPSVCRREGLHKPIWEEWRGRTKPTNWEGAWREAKGGRRRARGMEKEGETVDGLPRVIVDVRKHTHAHTLKHTQTHT